MKKAYHDGVHFEPGFAPSLPQLRGDDDALRSLLGEAGRFLRENPQFASPRAFVDLWNLFRHRNRSLELDDFGYDEAAARTWEPLFDFLYSIWWRVTLSGAANIPNTGSCLLYTSPSPRD